MTPDDLTKLYQSIILDHAKAPRNRRCPATVSAHAHRDNPMCGDHVTVYVTNEKGVSIADAAFEGEGCAISLASASILTETIQSMPLQDALTLAQAITSRLLDNTGDTRESPLPASLGDRPEIQAILSVANFPMRTPCAALAWEALAEAFVDVPS